MKNKRKISNILIYPKFQLTLLLCNSLIFLFTAFLVYWKVSEIFERLFSIGREINLPENHAYFSFITKSHDLLNLNLGWAFAFSLFLVIAVTLLLSHKIVGPIYNLKNYFLNLEINQDKKLHLRFRKGDYFSELPEIINRSLDRVSKK